MKNYAIMDKFKLEQKKINQTWSEIIQEKYKCNYSFESSINENPSVIVFNLQDTEQNKEVLSGVYVQENNQGNINFNSRPEGLGFIIDDIFKSCDEILSQVEITE